jgi:hypothetical protein
MKEAGLEILAAILKTIPSIKSYIIPSNVI